MKFELCHSDKSFPIIDEDAVYEKALKRFLSEVAFLDAYEGEYTCIDIMTKDGEFFVRVMDAPYCYFYPLSDF